jgi:molybdopterin-guanine dinucleotide biosynthesis protein A
MAAHAARSPRADVTGAVLAGGQGRRVNGRDKGLMLLSGKPLVEWVCSRLHAQAAAVLICANRNAARYAAYGQVIADPSADFRGPLARIAAALGACESAWLLTVPVDSPAIPNDLVRRLAENVAQGEAAVTVAHDGERRQPLFALYRRDLAVSARSALEEDLPVWRWQDECGATEVDFSDQAGAFANLNSVEQFHDWELHRHG